MTLVTRLLTLAQLPRGRVALSLALGALALGFGVALITAAGYLISRAAEQPAILSLTTIIVVVRFFALARPLARYLERLASHDLALRALGRIRATVYQRIEPLAPGELDTFRRGDLVRAWSATSTRSRGSICAGSGRRSSASSWRSRARRDGIRVAGGRDHARRRACARRRRRPAARSRDSLAASELARPTLAGS